MNARAIAENLREQINEVRRQGAAILDNAKAEGRNDLTAEETKRSDALINRHDKLKAQRDNMLAIASEDELADEMMSHLPTVVAPGANRGASNGRTAAISVTRNERTYHPGIDAERGLSNSPGGAFLLDVGAAFMGDFSATERLMRHSAEMRVDHPHLEERANSGTANFAGLVVPFYAVQDAAPAVTAARPMADVMNGRILSPTGMSVNQSRITTPSAAGIQGSENTAVASQAIDDTLLTMPVETAAGYVQLSRQAVERGLLTEEITTADLLTRVAVSLENQLISEAVTGLALTSSTTGQTYTNAAVDTTAVPAFLKQLPQAQNTLENALLVRAQPGFVVMHPRRFNWLTAASSASWPLLSGGTVPVQSSGVMLTDSYGPSVRAVLTNGMKVVTDANVTTLASGSALTGGTQDHVYVISAQESYLYEPAERTVMLRAEQSAANQLAIQFVAWTYFAYTFSRYPGQSVLVSGTGLGAPSFA